MTYKTIDPEDLEEYVGHQVMIVSDYGWDMNDWVDHGILRGVDDCYFYLQPDGLDDDEFEDWRPLGGSAVGCISHVRVYY